MTKMIHFIWNQIKEKTEGTDGFSSFCENAALSLSFPFNPKLEKIIRTRRHPCFLGYTALLIPVCSHKILFSKHREQPAGAM